ncbi:MAG: hydroxyacid dehydrogenase [Alphaproteobacteria bacterium]|nr:hydroxyacid dehydrogenase [Alphaproteobacteria bacterium]
MASNKKKLVFFERWADPIAEEILGREPDIELIRLSLADPPERIWAAMAEAHGYQWPRPPYVGSRELVRRAPHLLAMSSQGSGCDVMDFPACNEAGILIVNQAGLGGREAVAGHALAMMLALSKQLIQSDRAMRRDRNWHRLDYIGDDLTGKTVGIVGFGNIGTRTGELCRTAFAMRVLVYDPYLSSAEIDRHGGEKVELDALLRQSDFVSVHCPLTPETRGMIGVAQLMLMKPTAYFICTARGGICDELALAQILRDKRIAGAGIDVWEQEPPPLDHPLFAFDNVVTSIHIAGVTRSAYRSCAEAAAMQWIEIFKGKRPPRLVNPEVWPGYKERYRRVMGEPVSG